MICSFQSINSKKYLKKVLTFYNKNVNIILVLRDNLKIWLCGYYSKEDTPVPIPNTEVKLFSADGTWGATSWESKT